MKLHKFGTQTSKQPFFQLMLFLLLSLAGISCSKNDSNSTDGGGGKANIPQELVGGYFQAGTFSMSQYSNYDGSYAGNANEICVGYRFLNEKGDAEQYFYYNSVSYYCREQVLGMRKGTVVFDQEKKTFEFFAKSGKYRQYNSCGSSQSPGYGEWKNYGAADLYPEYKATYDNYTIVKENGKTIWRITFEDNSVLNYEESEEPK